MSIDSQLEQLIDQTIQGAVATLPMYFAEIENNKEVLKVNDPKEFVYGLIMGISLGMCGAIVPSIIKRTPTPEDQIKIRDMILKKIPQIHEQIFK